MLLKMDQDRLRRLSEEEKACKEYARNLYWNMSEKEKGKGRERGTGGGGGGAVLKLGVPYVLLWIIAALLN